MEKKFYIKWVLFKNHIPVLKAKQNWIRLVYLCNEIWLKNATGVDTSDLASLKSDNDKLDTDELEKVPSGLKSLKSKLDYLDIGKLKTVPTYLKGFSNVVDIEVLEKSK